MSKFNNLKVKTKLFLLVGVAVFGLAAFVLFTYTTVNEVKIGSPAYNQIISDKDLWGDMVNPAMILTNEVVTTYKMLSENDPAKLQALVETAKTERPTMEKAWDERMKKLDDEKLKSSLKEKVLPPALKYFEIREKELIPTLLKGDKERASAIATGVMKDMREDHERATKDALKSLEEKSAKNQEETAAMVAWRLTYMFLMAFAVIAAVSVLGWFIARGIIGPLSQVVQKLQGIATGDTNQTLDYQSKDEIGALADAFRSLTVYLKEATAAVEALGKGDTSVKIAPRSAQDVLAQSVTQTVASMQGLIDETNQLIKAAQEGNLQTRGNAAKFHGAYAELVKGVNSMMNAVTAPINEASDCLQQLAANDLTVQMSGDYKGDFANIKNALNRATQNLDESMLQIVGGAEQVSSAASEISAGSQSLAQGASEQASTLEEVSSSIQEISASTKQNAVNAKEARSMAESAKSSADKGFDSMNRLSDAIGKIKASSDATAKIVKTIEEIAFQTNLLALNAAVEAARAGDAGKGFAVVAEEVRNLAMRSAESAKQTAELIDEAVKNTDEGVSYNEEVLSNLQEINERVEKVAVVVEEIAAASDQQSQGVEQINVAVEQMNSVTQQAAANSEESASAAEELSGQSQEMLSLISRFNLSGSTNRSRSTPNTHKKQTRSHNAQPTFAGVTPKNGNGNGNGKHKLQDPKHLIPFDDMDDDILREF